MNSLTSAPRLSAVAGLVAGAAWFVSGAIRVTSGDATFQTVEIETALEHVLLALFSLSVLGTAIGTLGISRGAGARVAGLAVLAGGTVLALAATASNLHGDDYAWFPMVAVPANALWLFGTIAVAVRAKRAGAVPTWVAYALPLVQVFALPLSVVGGGLLAGAIWLAVGYLMLTGGLGRAVVSPAAA
jgi:hypothetical protein